MLAERNHQKTEEAIDYIAQLEKLTSDIDPESRDKLYGFLGRFLYETEQSIGIIPNMNSSKGKSNLMEYLADYVSFD